MTGKTFTVEIRVSQNWIEDGFDMTEERCRQIAEELLPYATEEEITVKVVRPLSGEKGTEMREQGKGKWTEGPWAVERPYGEPGVYVTAANPHTTNPLICKLIMGNENANARLIAAAPEMVEALRQALAEWDASEGACVSALAVDAMREALAKAEGRED